MAQAVCPGRKKAVPDDPCTAFFLMRNFAIETMQTQRNAGVGWGAELVMVRPRSLPLGLMNTGRLYIPQLVRQQYQQEQGNRQPHAHGQRLHGAVALALVAHQEKQGRAQAAQDQDKSDGDDDFHGWQGPL